MTVDVLDPTQPLVLYIDGYNIIGQRAAPQEAALQGRHGRARRRLLLEDVSQFALGRFEAYVVYDASGWSAGGARARSAAAAAAAAASAGNSPDRHEVELGTTIAWAHDSADAYIERETKRLGDASKRQVWVATNDGPCADGVGARRDGLEPVAHQGAEGVARRILGAAAEPQRPRGGARVTRDAWQEELGELFGGREEELNRASNKPSRRDREALDAPEAEAQRGAAAPPKGAMARAQQLAEQRRLGNRVRAPPRRRPAADSESSGPGSLEP